MLFSKRIKIFILLISLLSYISTYDKVKLSFPSDEGSTFNYVGNKTFQIDFSDSPYIFSFNVKSLSQNNQIITTSEIDEDCIKGRKNLVNNPYGVLNLLIPGAEISNNRQFFICVECQNEDNYCNYETTIKESSPLNLELNKQYILYNFDNIKLSNILERNLLNTLQDNTFIIIWIKGKNFKGVVYNCDKLSENNFEQGEIYLTKKNSEIFNDYILNIDIQNEDLISFGNVIVTPDNKENELRLNDLERFGYLKKDILEEICFPLDIDKVIEKKIGISYITGVIYTKIAKIYYKDKNLEKSYEKYITNGNIFDIISLDEIYKKEYFCVSFVNDNENYYSDEVIFSIQFTSPKYLNYNKMIYPKLQPGIIYTFGLTKGEMGIFSGNLSKDSIKINFNMKSISGVPHMHFDLCENYPNCDYDEEDLESLVTPNHSNKMSLYSFYNNNEISPISASQPLLIVHCLKGYTSPETYNSELCTFDISIFSEKDYIMLKDRESYSQYIIKDEQNYFTLSFDGYKNIKKIYLDLIIFSGDVIFHLDTSLKMEKYFLSNKIYYNIIFDTEYKEKQIEFYVKGVKNSFYMIQCQLIFNEKESEYTNILESGINYIESIDINNKDFKSYKYMKFQNLQKYEKLPFLANFYSPNCVFNVTRIINKNGKNTYKEIDTSDDYAQEIINIDDESYNDENYIYKIESESESISEYNKKLCAIYVSGVELDEDKSYSPTDINEGIFVTEGIPQIFIFNENHKIIKYTYHVANRSDDVIIDFELLEKTTYEVIIYIQDSRFKYEISRNVHLLIYKEEIGFYCEENQICIIRMYIILAENGKTPRLETTISQTNEPPLYLEKNSVQEEILIGNNYKYYYLDIGKGQTGYIIADYKRGNGNIYGKIVPKNQIDESSNADWRGFHFPKEKYLDYDSYLKKLIINEKDTNICESGCYLLLTFQFYSSENDKENNLRSHQLLIINRIDPPKQYNEIPSIEMTINCFVIGSIPPSKDKEVYDFYELTIPYDSNEIYIDWQADFPNLFIYIGEKQATKDNNHFSFSSIGHDTVYKITKEEIIKNKNITLKNKNSLKDLKLNVGIQTNYADSLSNSVYALRFYLPTKSKNSDLEIFHIRSDQKIQCRPQSRDNNLFCYFAIIFDKGDIDGELTVYMQSQNKNKIIHYYANLVDARQIEKNNLRFLEENIPKPGNCTYNYETSKLPYIYIPEIPDGESLLIKVETKTNDIIELFSSINHGDKIIIPNPSTQQLFSIKENSEIFLDFTSSYSSLIINIKSISGKGEIFWEDEKEKMYYLNGDDELSFPSGNGLSNLIIHSNQDNYSNNNLPGFIFLLNFYPKNDFIFEQIKIGSSVELNYNDFKFPLNYFTKLDYSEDVTISFNFYDFNLEKNKEELDINNSLFVIFGKIISEEEVLELRLNGTSITEKNGNYIKGYFSYPLGSLFIDRKLIDNFDSEKKKVPYLFFTIEDQSKVKYNFLSIKFELSIFGNSEQINDDVYVPEKVYINGLIEQSHIYYKLKVNKNITYIRLEFSSSSNCIDWSIDNLYEYIDTIEIEKEDINGRTNIDLILPNEEKIDYLYFTIYKRSAVQKCQEQNSNHYIFKYMSAKNEDEFLDYIINRQLNVKIDGTDDYKNYKINFNPISCINCQISYFLKIIQNFNKEENLNSISISENENLVYESKEPQFNLNYFHYDILAIKVMAKINQGEINEYLLYKPFLIMIEGTNELTSLEYDYDSTIVSLFVKKAFKKQKFNILFKEKEINPKYVKVEAISKNNLNQILYFSNTDPEGDKNRDQISYEQLSNSSYIWIKKEQFEKNNFYLIVECWEDSCDYDLNIYGQEFIEVDKIDFEYSYYVGKNNKEMEFKIKKDIIDDSTKNIVFYGFGDDNLSINLKNIEYITKCNSLGCVNIITSFDNEDNYYYLNVESNEGKYIHVGGRTVSEDGITDQIMGINSLQIFGQIYKDYKKECYLLPEYENKKDFYLTLILKNNPVKIYFLDKNNSPKNPQIIEEYNYEQYYSDINNYKYICISIPDGFNGDIPYLLHLSDPNQNIGLLSKFSPQINGHFYSRIIPKNAIVYFSGISNSFSQNVNYYMFGTEGYAKMYIYNCTTFPLCNFNNIESSNKLNILDNEINMANSWQSSEPILSPIDPIQYIMAVKCENIENSKTDFCKFKTLIYSNDEPIELIEKLPFTKNILKNENNNFIIDLSFKEGIKRIYIDIMITSGDVTVDVDEDKKIIENMSKFYLGNKIYFSINVVNKKLEKKLIHIHIKSNMNSYYIINSRYILNESENDSNYLFSGIDYLISLDKSNSKNDLFIYEHKLLESSSYLINFNSINCKLNIEKYKNNILQPVKLIKEYYHQDFISNYEDFDKNGYHYQISIKNENSLYDENTCIVFVNNLEIINDNTDIKREIILNENYPNKIAFNNFKKIRYLFPHSDPSKELEIYVTNYDYGYYSLNISYNNKKEGKNLEVKLNGNYFTLLNNDFLKDCQIDKFCKIFIEITLLDNNIITSEQNPMIEILVRRTENMPFYLSKGIVKNDFLRKSQNLYLYTDYNDQGYITVNFLKGQGRIFGKIVDRTDSTDSSDKTSIWQGYSFPNENDSNLIYDYYNKKLLINNQDTCENNCLILISIQSTVMSYDNNNSNEIYPISILANNVKSTTNKISKIKLDLEQYIVNSISLRSDQIYEYYEVSIPSETEVVQIELQSESLELYINIGQNPPTKEQKDLYFESKWRDNIYNISRDEIEQIIKKDIVENINLIIGVYNNYKNNNDTIYSIKVSIKQKGKENIIKVRGEKKTLCIPQSIENNNIYRCLFIILLEPDDYNNNLILYARSQREESNIKIYTNYIDYKVYKNKNNELYNCIPNENPSNNNLIIFNSLRKDNYVYVNVETDKPDIIELLTTLSTNYRELNPNLNFMQLFALKNDELIFSFDNTEKLIINIFSLSGKGKVYWEGETDSQYSISGRDDILSLTSNNNNNHKLVIKNMYDGKDSNNDIVSEFVFYFQYHLKIDLTEIYSGKTFEFINREEDFPLYFYSKMGEINYDINIVIIFHDIVIEKEGSNNKTIESSEFLITSSIGNQSLIFNMQRPKSIKDYFGLKANGTYDSALSVAQIYFKEDEIKNNLNQINIPYLFLGIDKLENSYINKYKTVSMDISILKENSEEIITEKKYQFGKITNEIKSYKLKIDKSNSYMRIQFASNNNNIVLSINTEKNNKKNSTNIKFDETKYERGKLFITFKKPLNEDFIYLNIFSKDKNIDKKLNNYVFKYINSENNFIEYPIAKNKPQIKYEKNDNQNKITVKFNKIEKNNLNIIYSLKAIPSKYSIKDEIINTIAITESNCLIIKEKNPKDENDVITMSINTKDEEIKCVEVIAQIKDGSITEYVAYNPICFDKEEDKNENKNYGIYFVFGFTALMILIIVFIVLLVLKNKYKKMNDEINEISYKISRAEENQDAEEGWRLYK